MARVLIAAQGLERDRILAAISVHSPNRVIILRSKKDVKTELTSEVERHIQALLKEIFPTDRPSPYPFVTKDGVETKEHTVDFFNLSSALAEISSIIDSERRKGNSVSIDISSGNKIVAVALFLAAQLHRVPVTYCAAGWYSTMTKEHPKLSRPTDPEQIAFSAEKSFSLPRLPIKLETLPFDLLEKLSSIKQVSSVTELVQLFTGEKRPSKSQIVFFSRKLDILLNYGYVEKRRWGRPTVIRITDEGEKVVDLVRIKVP